MGVRTLSIRDFYSSVWGEYADPLHHPITARALAIQTRIVTQRLRGTEPRRVLDLGCGPIPVVPAQPARLVVSADLVLEMLRHIKANRTAPVACLDARRLPFRNRCFDFIWCGLLIDHIPDADAWIQELTRVLAPGSTLGMACWQRSELPSERYPGNKQMRYTTAGGEELAVVSYPIWETALEILRRKDPHLEMESFPVVPGQYVLQVAWARIHP